MFNLLARNAEAYSTETFLCHQCNRDFEARVITWVDVTKTLQAKHAFLNWEFNSIQCKHCGYRHFSGTPFFYEDFEEGLLVAVFPSIPEDRGGVEKEIQKKYGYYPVLEFFYDMTQIWMLIYLQEYYKSSKSFLALSRIGRGEERLRKMLRFLKEDPLMIDVREKLTETLLGYAPSDDLEDLLGQAICTLEEMLPWPLDAHCLCGAKLGKGISCCGTQVSMQEHDSLLSRRYDIYCSVCKQSLVGAACTQCGRVFTWKLGTVSSFAHREHIQKRKNIHVAEKPQPPL
jgi:hypothetical protein